MNFLGLLLGLVIFVAILYQTIFTPVVGNKVKGQQQNKTTTSQAMQALKDAEQLKQTINSQNSSIQDRLDNSDKLSE